MRLRLERIARENGCILYIPSCVAFNRPDQEVADFLEKICCSTQSIKVESAIKDETTSLEAGSILVLRGAELRHFVDSAVVGITPSEVANLELELQVVPDDVGIVDLRDPALFLSVITSTFDVRHFNAVTSDDRYTIVKRSSHVEKLEREYTYFGLLPESMRRFFVQPFDYRREETSASYRMERLLLPDVALQWLHNSFNPAAFDQFLDRVFYFLQARSRKEVSPEQGRKKADYLYREKVCERIEQLERMEAFKQIEPYCKMAFGGVQALLERYLNLYKALGGQRDFSSLAIGHGDLCFSNILYSTASGSLKLIDPRGALTPDEMFTDAWYDVAKLSHSIEGTYDFINAGLFSIELSREGIPFLKTESPDHTTEVSQFRNRCRSIGMESRLVRLFEASLFISMTPLHIDVPLKVLAFLLNAAKILDEVESEAQWKGSEWSVSQVKQRKAATFFR
jgi:hypothetical protein